MVCSILQLSVIPYKEAYRLTMKANVFQHVLDVIRYILEKLIGRGGELNDILCSMHTTKIIEL